MTTTTTITPLSEHLRQMDEGYRDAGRYCDIDADVAAACTCAACGHQGLGYRAFVRPSLDFGREPRSYRAFAVCPSCQHSEEF